MILAQTFDVTADRILGHRSRLFDRVALSNQSGQRRARHHKPALIGGFEQNGIVVLRHSVQIAFTPPSYRCFDRQDLLDAYQ